MILLLNSIAHFLVDGLCAAVIFGQIAEERSLLILLYNTLAFSTQCLVGYIADRMRSVRRMEAISVILLVLGFALPVHGLLKILLIGAGNSGFHVAGGVMTLRESEGKAGRLGVFVAPGAAGLTLGTLYPGLGTAFAAALLAAAAVIYKIAVDEYDVKEQERIPDISITLLLTAAVAVRAIGGTAVRFPWNSGAADSLIMTMFVVAGKMAGGFLCDRNGYRRTAMLSLIPAAVLIAFCTSYMIPSLIGQFAINLTMPVTLWLLYRSMPESPGPAFGLAASALWPGTIAGKLMRLTGPALWICVIVSFLFGLGAILYAGKRIKRA